MRKLGRQTSARWGGLRADRSRVKQPGEAMRLASPASPAVSAFPEAC